MSRATRWSTLSRRCREERVGGGGGEGERGRFRDRDRDRDRVWLQPAAPKVAARGSYGCSLRLRRLQAREFAADHNMLFMEASAMRATNVSAAFRLLVAEVMHQADTLASQVSEVVSQ